MKNTNIILGTLAVSAIAVGSFFFPNQKDSQGEYSPKAISFKTKDAQSWTLAQNYYNDLRKNVNTGLIEDADYINALEHIQNMNYEKTTSFSFVEEGPDNVGGRTRAISVHPSNDNYIIAGAITGGLFKTDNGGNSWSRIQGWRKYFYTFITSIYQRHSEPR